MENTMMFLLLLLCSLSSAVTFESKDKAELSPSDFQAVLKGIIVKLDQLEKQCQATQVAFSASLTTSAEVYVGPFTTYVTLAFQNVISNIGNAYNPGSGFFTAPVRGAYHFEFYIAAYGQPSYPSSVVLVKNGVAMFSAYEHQSSGFGTSANGATLLLEARDAVYVQLLPQTVIYDSARHLSMFTGRLLFTL